MSAAPEYLTNRLFAVHGRTSSESSANRRANLAAQSDLFDVEPTEPTACPACGGSSPEACTCHRTGAEALDLFDVEHPAEPVRAVGTCCRCHEHRELTAHGALCAPCLAVLEDPAAAALVELVDAARWMVDGASEALDYRRRARLARALDAYDAVSA